MGLGLLAVDVEGRIVVDALSAEGDPAVEAGAGRGVVAHMPFAEIADFVAAGGEKFGEGFEFGADGGAGGGGDEGVCELGSFAGDTVDIGGFDEGVAGVAGESQRMSSTSIKTKLGLGEGWARRPRAWRRVRAGTDLSHRFGAGVGDEKLEYWRLSAG